MPPVNSNTDMHRDPETGKFVAGNEGMGHDYHDTESWTFQELVRYDKAEDEDFATRQADILDIDQITDRRREQADLLYADLKLVGRNGRQDQPGAVYLQFQTGESTGEPVLATEEVTAGTSSDSLDAVGRPMYIDVSSINQDDADSQELTFENMADPVFFPRNEISIRAEVENLGSNGDTVLGMVMGQMVFGLRETEGSGR